MAKASDLFATGVTSHAGLTGLGADDHPQYHTDARGDVRYYLKAQIDSALAAKADGTHTHNLAALSDVTITSISGGEILKWNGTKFVNQTLAEAGIAAAAHSHAWGDITGKPSTFTPSAHSHAVADVTGLQAALYGKSDDGHGHAIVDVTGLQTALDGKSGTGHSHAWSAITAKPATFAPSAHGHPISDVTGLQTALDGKSDDTHGHAVADVAGLQTALDGKSDAGHSHSIADVAGLQTALDSKSGTGHSHAWSAITSKPSTFAPSAHGHPISDVTGLQTALDGKTDFKRAIVTAAHTAEAEQFVAVDSSVAAITVTAPASPAANTFFYVGDVGANAEANNITVAFGAEKYNGNVGDTFIIDVSEFGAGFLFTGTTWRLFR